MTPPTLRPLTVGEILDTSFTLYRRHFAALATVALVCTGLPLVLRLFLEAGGGLMSNLSLAFLYGLSLVVLNLIATGATVFIVSESYLGRPITAREALHRATPHIGRQRDQRHLGNRPFRDTEVVAGRGWSIAPGEQLRIGSDPHG